MRLATCSVIGVLGSACGRLEFDLQTSDARTGDTDAFACTTLGQLRTSFDAELPSWFITNVPGTPPDVGVAVSGGALNITLVPDVADARYGNYQSVCPYDLRNASIGAEIISVPQQIAGIEMGMGVTDTGGPGFSLQGNTSARFDNVQ